MSVQIRIKESGEYLDLQREFLGLNYQVFDLKQLENRQGTFSNDFEIPNTAHNRAALGHSTQNNVVRSGYSVQDAIPAECYEQGIRISNGFIQVVTRDTKTITVCFYGENCDMFALLRNSNLRDLDLEYLDHIYDASTIINSFRNTSGFIYPVINWGNLTDRGTVQNNPGDPTSIFANEIFPCFYFDDIVKAIFKGIGYKVKGTLLNRALFKKSVLAFNADSRDFFENKSFYVDNINPDDFTKERFNVAPGATVKHDFARTADSFQGKEYENELFDLATNTYTADDDYTTTITYRFDFRDFANNNAGVGIPMPTLYIYKNGVVAATSTTGNAGVKASITVTAGDTLEFYVKNNHSSTISFTGTAFAEVSQLIIENATIYANRCLPNMLQVDFLKFLVFRFFAVISVDPFSKTVYLNQFNDIKNNPAEDWSNKVDMSIDKEPVTDYADILDKYARINKAIFELDEEDTFIKEYNSKNVLPFGAGQFTIDNDFLEGETNVFDTPFSGTLLVESFDTGKLLIPYIPRYLQANSYNENIPIPRVLTIYGNVDVSQVSNLTELEILGTTVTQFPFSYFYKPKLGFDVDTVKESLAFGVQNIFAPNDLGAFESDYLYLIEILQNPEIRKAYLKLNQVDITNLNYLKKKYFEKFGGYFYLNVVESYDGSGDSIQCELIKL